MAVLVIVQSAVLLVLCVLVAGLLRAYAAVLARLHQLDGGARPQASPSQPTFRTAPGVAAPAGSSAGAPSWPVRSPSAADDRRVAAEFGPSHDIAGVGLTGEVVSVRAAGMGLDTVLVFLSSGCAGCDAFWRDLRSGSAFAGDGRLLVVTKGAEEECADVLRQLCPPGIDLVLSSRAWADYGVPGSPYVIVVDGDSGRITGEGSGTSLRQVSGLVRQSRGGRAMRAGGGSVAKPRADADREVDVDRTLLAAGISPGHPSLYPMHGVLPHGDQSQNESGGGRDAGPPSDAGQPVR